MATRYPKERVLGGKSTGSLLWHLRDGPVRFNALARQVPGASKKMVADRLARLEEQGLVRRCVIADRPVAVEYRLPPRGCEALAVLESLQDWVEAAGL